MMIFNRINALFEQENVGPGERILMPLKYLIIASLTTAALFVLGSYLWPGLVFVYIWLFLLSMWAVLHVKKSAETWRRFDEIDQRESDYAEEVDKRFDQLQKELKALKAMIKPPKEEKKPTKRGRPSKKKTKQTKPKPAKQAPTSSEPSDGSLDPLES